MADPICGSAAQVSTSSSTREPCREWVQERLAEHGVVPAPKAPKSEGSSECVDEGNTAETGSAPTEPYREWVRDRLEEYGVIPPAKAQAITGQSLDDQRPTGAFAPNCSCGVNTHRR